MCDRHIYAKFSSSQFLTTIGPDNFISRESKNKHYYSILCFPSSQFLTSIGRYDEAAQQLALLVNDDNFISRESKNKHELWAELCAMISRYPAEIKLNVDAIIRGGKCGWFV